MDEGVVEKIRAAGGEVYAVTSEPQQLADQAHEHWELTFDNVGDPHQEISKTCSARGWLTLFANRGDHEFLQRGADWKVEHPKGFFQPGVLALTNNRRVLYRWRSVPTAENLNGTTMRPTAAHVWDQVGSALQAGDDAGDASHDDNPIIDGEPPPRLLFFAAIIANGWFLRARAFAYSPGVGSVPSRFKAAFSRWFVFLFFWIIALATVPTGLVAMAFTTWLVWIGLDLKRVLQDMGDQVELRSN
ncbi:MAG: hypothetical protein JJ957_02170 [Pseudomonadales bacterium]|nr:hypothetical protein [Pseudomonadales bacterium]MBO6594617.1 hypothetical protein [Pseudomonadales bacterium]MBO6821823.1 hypothetical protein [Pseudomonadales bacterium]